MKFGMKIDQVENPKSAQAVFGVDEEHFDPNQRLRNLDNTKRPVWALRVVPAVPEVPVVEVVKMKKQKGLRCWAVHHMVFQRGVAGELVALFRNNPDMVFNRSELCEALADMVGPVNPRTLEQYLPELVQRGVLVKESWRDYAWNVNR